MADETNETTQQDETQQTTTATETTQETKPDTFKVTVDGRDREYTAEERDAAAQKWFAGDNRLQEANRVSKEIDAKRGEDSENVNLKAHLAVVQDNTADINKRIESYKAIAPSFGLTAAQVDQQIAQWKAGNVNQNQQNQTSAKPDQEFMDRIAKRDGQVNNVLREMAQRVVSLEEENRLLRTDYDKKREDEAVAAVHELVQKDAELARYLKAGDERSDAVYTLAVDAVRSHIPTDDRPLGPDDLQSALSQVRALLKKLDIRTTKAMPGIPGFGPGGVGAQGYDLETEPEVKPGDLANFMHRMEARRQQGQGLGGESL